MTRPAAPHPAADAGRSALEASGLSCRRNGRLLFADLSFRMNAGRALALTGPNGIGKTSLLRILAGLLEPEAGTLMLQPEAGTFVLQPEAGDGRSELPIAERALFVSSRDPLKAALTVRELVSGWRDILFAGEAGKDEDGDLAPALDAFALRGLADTPCAYLSSGQRRRVSLARLLLASTASRPLWLLDEPTNALDAHARTLLASACARHLDAGGLIVAATHDALGWDRLDGLDLGAYAPDLDHARGASA